MVPPQLEANDFRGATPHIRQPDLFEQPQKIEDLVARLVNSGTIMKTRSHGRRRENLAKEAAAILVQLNSFRCFDLKNLVVFLTNKKNYGGLVNEIGMINSRELLRRALMNPDVYSRPADKQVFERTKAEVPKVFREMVALAEHANKVRLSKKAHALPLKLMIEREQNLRALKRTTRLR
ncbi:MAG: hypothetical protein AABW99_00995 [archaeon]